MLAALEQLEGFEAPAVEWERSLLPARVRNYDPRSLDNLCLAGVVGWGRISPHPAWAAQDGGAPRRVIPTGAAPITFFLRESADWLPAALAAKCAEEAVLARCLSAEAQGLRRLLHTRGAAFVADLQRQSGSTKQVVNVALWELATAGLASADGFDQLRALMDPRRKSVHLEQTPAVSLRKRAAARTTAGRWSLLCENSKLCEDSNSSSCPLSTNVPTAAAITEARRTESALDAYARVLLYRYGVVFRELLQREANAPKWRDLAPVLRRLEARGEIRGGRFVAGPFGEQFALAEAVEGLREARRRHTARATEPELVLAAADPLNLLGILVPGEREAAIPGRTVRLRNGISAEPPPEGVLPPPNEPPNAKRKGRRSVADLLRREHNGSASLPAGSKPAPSLGLFPS